MKFEVDIHTHTIASGHAYSTLQENLAAAERAGLKVLGISDHAPGMPGSAYIYHFQNFRVLPRVIKGVTLLRGVEANILTSTGRIDMTDANLELVDYAIASLHPPCFKTGSKKEATLGIIRAMQHKKVKVIGHPDDNRFPLDYEEVVRASKSSGVYLEVNNSSINPTGFRANAKENILKFLDLCVKHDLPIICGSDAHISFDVGNFDFCRQVLLESDFPEELVLNRDAEKFLQVINA